MEIKSVENEFFSAIYTSCIKCMSDLISTCWMESVLIGTIYHLVKTCFLADDAFGRVALRHDKYEGNSKKNIPLYYL